MKNLKSTYSIYRIWINGKRETISRTATLKDVQKELASANPMKFQITFKENKKSN